MKENDIFNKEKWKWIVREAIPIIINLTDEEISLPLISLYLSGSCKDKILTVNKKTGFPIINITGKETAEKIRYVSYFNELSKGGRIDNFNGITIKDIINFIAENNISPYIVSNLPTDKIGARAMKFYSILKSAYSSLEYQMGTSDLSINKYNLRRAIIVLSELPITSEELNDRVIVINFPSREFTDDGLPYVGFPRVTTQMLDDLDLGYFLEGYQRFIDELYDNGRFKELYAQAEIIVNDSIKYSKFNSLQILNKEILVFGALLLRELLRTAESDFKVTDDDIRDMLINIT